MEDLNQAFNAEELSDEVLTEISQLLESQVDVDNQDRIYDYISKKYNLPRQVVMKHICYSTILLLRFLLLLLR
jgi:hypothetical protein